MFPKHLGTPSHDLYPCSRHLQYCESQLAPKMHLVTLSFRCRSPLQCSGLLKHNLECFLKSSFGHRPKSSIQSFSAISTLLLFLCHLHEEAFSQWTSSHNWSKPVCPSNSHGLHLISHKDFHPEWQHVMRWWQVGPIPSLLGLCHKYWVYLNSEQCRWKRTPPKVSNLLKNRSLEHWNFLSSQIVREAFSLFPELCLGFRRGSVHGAGDRIGSQKIEKHRNLCRRGEAQILKKQPKFHIECLSINCARQGQDMGAGRSKCLCKQWK